MNSEKTEEVKGELPPGERPCTTVKMKAISSFFMPKQPPSKGAKKPVQSESPKQTSSIQNGEVEASSAQNKMGKDCRNGRITPITLDDSITEFEEKPVKKLEKGKKSVDKLTPSTVKQTVTKENDAKCVSYEDFLQSTSSTDKQSKVDEKKETASEISYEDFLKSESKEPPTSKSNDTLDKNEKEVESETEILASKPKGCVSISNFFSKVDKGSVKHKEEKKVITVKAVIHSNSGTPSTSPPVSNCKAKKGKAKKSNVVSNADMSIICLDSDVGFLDVEKNKPGSSRRNKKKEKNQEEKQNDKNTKSDNQHKKNNTVNSVKNIEIEAKPTVDVDITNNMKEIEEPKLLVISDEENPVSKSEPLPKPAKAFPLFCKAVPVEAEIKSEIESKKNDNIVIPAQSTTKSFPLFCKSKEIEKIAESGDKKEDIEVTITSASPPTKKNAALQMAALDSIKTDPGKKRAQATLSFGSGGCMAVNKVIKSPEPQEEKKKGRKSTDKNDNVTATGKEEGKTMKKKVKKTKKKLEMSVEDQENMEFEAEKTLKKPIKKTIQKKATKQALKSKANLTRAAQLVAKARGLPQKKSVNVSPPVSSPAAKRRRRGMSSDEASSTPSEGLRRSSRASSRVAQSAISVCVQEEKSKWSKSESSDDPATPNPEKKGSKKNKETAEPVKKKLALADAGKKEKKEAKTTKAEKVKTSEKESATKTPKKEKGTKAKDGKLDTPKKKAKTAPNTKLASIFSKKPAADADDNDDVVIVAEERVLTPEELAKKEERRHFLLSGVPEALKRQKAAIEAVAAGDYVPLPRVSHVQQRGDDEEEGGGVWDLQSVTIPERKVDAVVPLKPLCTWQRTMTIRRQLKKFTYCEPGVIEPETIKLLLAEIATHNTAYPVRRVYKQLLQHQKNSITPVPEPISSSTAAAAALSEPNNPKKRKLDIEKANTKKRRRSSKEWSVVVALSDSDDEVKKEPPRRALRLSLRRSSKNKPKEEATPKAAAAAAKVEEKAQKEEKPAEEEIQKECRRELQWTEKFAPQCSAEMLGNSRCVERLKSWLKEWKIQTCREMRRLEKLQKQQEKKQQQKKGSTVPGSEQKEWWDEDDSDFAPDGNSSCSDYNPDDTEDDCRLGNTMLITGPHGVGKTAMVYAMAQELGYKVFEVNASSRRSGKQVLLDLQEATQSHQVRHSGQPVTLGADNAANPVPKPAAAAAPAKKLPTAFAGFFKTTGGVQKKTDDAKANDKTPKAPSTPKRKKKGGAAAAGYELELTPKSKKRGRPAAATTTPAKVASPRAKRGRPRKSSDDVEVVGFTPSPQKKCRGGRKQKAVEEPVPVTTGEEKKKGLDLSSVSLILFEEADLVFDEDRGFWSAIQTFIYTTKRPIVLTTADKGFLRHFDPRGELRLDVLPMRTQPRAHIASYLQVVCLSEKLRTDARDMLHVVKCFHGDLRRCLLYLNLWAESGGSHSPCKDPITYSKLALTKKPAETADEGFASQSTGILEENSQNAMPVSNLGRSQDSQDTEDEFESIGGGRSKRRKRLVIEDETSCDSMPGTPRRAQAPLAMMRRPFQGLVDESSQDSQPEVELGGGGDALAGQLGLEREELKDGQPAMHSGILPAVMGMEQTDVLKVLNESDLHTSTSLLSHFRGLDLTYSNLPHLLHLPWTITAPGTYTCHKSAAPLLEKLQRIKNNNDLFDSDGDSEDDVKKPETPAQSSTINEPEKFQPKTKRVLTEDDRLIGESIDTLANFYDNFSFMDSFLAQKVTTKTGSCSQRNFDLYPGHLEAGQLDAFPIVDGVSVNDESGVSDFVKIGSVRRCRKTLGKVLGSCSGDAREALTLPVEDAQNVLHVETETPLQNRSRCSYQRTAESVYDVLNPVRAGSRQPGGGGGGGGGCASERGGEYSVSKAAIVQDYLPMLRLVCKGEQLRQAAKTKRRFLHYFDQIHLNLKQSTLDTLVSSFS